MSYFFKKCHIVMSYSYDVHASKVPIVSYNSHTQNSQYPNIVSHSHTQTQQPHCL